MISHTSLQWQSSDWQSILQTAIRDSAELLQAVGVPQSSLDTITGETAGFAVLAPRPFVARMEYGNPKDPLLLQVLALQEEIAPTAVGTTDPLEEQRFTPVPGIIHKYFGRVLLMTAGTCAVNCRYCFRRHNDYAQNILTPARLNEALTYLRSQTDITEVILSGGDPLLTSDRKLSELVAELEAIPHIQRLRIHTRLPIVIPQRITTELCQRLGQSRFQVTMVVHCNHPKELDVEVGLAMAQLKAQGITLLNQTVLLKNINNCAATLETLSVELFKIGVLPYYLHTLDPVQGAAHFAQPMGDSKQLHQTLQARLPGYLVPKLVSEIPGGASKTLIY